MYGMGNGKQDWFGKERGGAPQKLSRESAEAKDRSRAPQRGVRAGKVLVAAEAERSRQRREGGGQGRGSCWPGKRQRGNCVSARGSARKRKKTIVVSKRQNWSVGKVPERLTEASNPTGRRQRYLHMSSMNRENLKQTP